MICTKHSCVICMFLKSRYFRWHRQWPSDLDPMTFIDPAGTWCFTNMSYIIDSLWMLTDHIWVKTNIFGGLIASSWPFFKKSCMAIVTWARFQHFFFVIVILFQDLIIHVMDRSHPDYQSQQTDVMESVRNLLSEQNLQTMIHVHNKTDLVER